MDFDFSQIPLPEVASISVCIPHECSPTDIFGELGEEVACTIDKELELDGGDIAFM